MYGHDRRRPRADERLGKVEIHRASSRDAVDKTGVAPTCSTAFAEATNVIAGRRTSSPGPTPRQMSPRNKAAVHDETQRTCETPRYSPSISSKRWTFGPVPIQPRSSEFDHFGYFLRPMSGLPKIKNSSRI